MRLRFRRDALRETAGRADTLTGAIESLMAEFAVVADMAATITPAVGVDVGTIRKSKKAGIMRKKISLLFAFALMLSLVLGIMPIKAEASWKFVGEGWYNLAPKCNSSKYLDISGGSTSRGANVQIYDYNGTDAQRFYFSSVGNGYYVISNKTSGKVLDVNGESKKSGTNVQQWDYKFGDHQIWKVVDAGGGYYYIKPSHNENLALSVNGTNVRVENLNYGNNQKWKLWLGTSSKSNTAISGLNETSLNIAVVYNVKSSGKSTVTVWAARRNYWNVYSHHVPESASRFKVIIKDLSGNTIVNKIVTGSSNTFTVNKKYNQYKVYVYKYTNNARDWGWEENWGQYCQVSLSNASIR